MHVADKRRTAFREHLESLLGLFTKQLTNLLWIRNPVHADVDHSRAGLDVFASNETRTSDCDHEQVGSSCYRCQIPRTRMTDRHRRISLQQQLRHRTSHDLTATNHTRVRTANLDTVIVE